MATHQHERPALRNAGSAINGVWTGGQLGIDTLHLCERPFQRGSTGPDWTAMPEGILLHVGRYLDNYAVGNARSLCKAWRRAFSLNVRSARLEILEHRAAQARAFVRAFIRAFPSTTELVLDVTFRRTAREKIQAALEEHFLALHDFGLQALQLNLDLNSFNERKIKLPDVALLSSWNGLTRLTLQESGWRSQQLRVDASTVFSSLPGLQELSVECKYSGNVKAKWSRPPSPAERLAARMPTWPPGAASASATSPSAAATTAAARGLDALGAAGAAAVSVLDGDAAMEEVQQHHNHHNHHHLAAQQQQQPRLVLTQHLRCQMTQNQSMSGELQKALRRITQSLQPHVSALTFEIVEETYAEPTRCSTPLELSALPGLKSLTVLSGAEDALAHSKLDIVGATGLESLVLFDVSCGCWCYKKPGHGIPPRLLSAPPACLRSLTVVGFVVNQCQNLHGLASLTCLEELRLEQPDPDSLAAVAGELMLTWLPPSLRKLKLHSVVLPPCGVSAAALTVAAAAGLQHPPAAAAESPQLFGGGGGGGGVNLIHDVAAVAPLPLLRELHLSKCKVPTLGVLGVCTQLTTLGVINCLSCSGMLPVSAVMPELRALTIIHTIAAEQEQLGPGGARGAGGNGMPAIPPGMFDAAAAAAAHGRGGGGSAAAAAAAARAGPAAASGAAGLAAAAPPPPPLHVSGLPMPPVAWGSDEQVAAAAACRSVTSLELILPRGTAGYPAVAALASMPQLTDLDVSLPCGPSECMMGLARLGRGGGRLRRLTLWVDSRTCVSRNRARQLQAIQRNLQSHMPDTLVEWAGAESRNSSWTGLEARVFSPH